MMKSYKLLILLPFLGCGAGLYGNIEGGEIAKYAENKTKEYFGIDKIPHGDILLTSLEQMQRTCGPNAGACNQLGTIVIHEDTDEYICQQIMHELGHSVTYELYDSWDHSHELAYDFYFGGYISETCAIYNTGE